MTIRIIFAFFAYILNLFDLVATDRLVQMYGIEIEGNPVGRWLYEKRWRMWVFKIILPFVVTIALICVQTTVTDICIGILCVAYAALALYHLYIIKRLN